MELPVVMFVEYPEAKGADLLLCCQLPYITFKVWRFRTNEELQVWKARQDLNPYGYHELSDYRITLTCYHYLHDTPRTRVIETYLPLQFPIVAAFYVKNRIEGHEPRYTKYKK